MKKTNIILLFLLVVTSLAAQTVPDKSSQNKSIASENTKHKIIFQVTTDDTLVYKSLMKQLNNIITVSPESEIEVVCHGPGLNMLLADRTIVQAKIQQLKKKNIQFVACEFSMSEKNITKDKMIPEAGYVKYGILEIVSKQETGWSYIKSGF
jgi:intracellular sulfur oxidation DsrE/DsrF family protein